MTSQVSGKFTFTSLVENVCSIVGPHTGVSDKRLATMLAVAPAEYLPHVQMTDESIDNVKLYHDSKGLPNVCVPDDHPVLRTQNNQKLMALIEKCCEVFQIQLQDLITFSYDYDVNRKRHHSISSEAGQISEAKRSQILNGSIGEYLKGLEADRGKLVKRFCTHIRQKIQMPVHSPEFVAKLKDLFALIQEYNRQP